MRKNISKYNEKGFIFGHSLSSRPENALVHMHDYYEIYYFLSGNVTYYIEGQAYKLKSGDLLVINNRELHRPKFDSYEPYERTTIHFTSEFITPFQTDNYNLLYCFDKRKLGQHNKIGTNEIINFGIDKYFDKIEYYILNGLPESNVMIKVSFTEMLVMLNKIINGKRNVSASSFEYDQKIVSILEYINKNLHTKISLSLLEQTFFVNKYYLCHLFKKNTGFTVMEYVTYKRIMKAKELLSGGAPVMEVCHSVGFEDYSNFYRVFKKIVNMSPKQFAKSQ